MTNEEFEKQFGDIFAKIDAAKKQREEEEANSGLTGLARGAGRVIREILPDPRVLSDVLRKYGPRGDALDLLTGRPPERAPAPTAKELTELGKAGALALAPVSGGASVGARMGIGAAANAGAEALSLADKEALAEGRYLDSLRPLATSEGAKRLATSTALGAATAGFGLPGSRALKGAVVGAPVGAYLEYDPEDPAGSIVSGGLKGSMAGAALGASAAIPGARRAEVTAAKEAAERAVAKEAAKAAAEAEKEATRLRAGEALENIQKGRDARVLKWRAEQADRLPKPDSSLPKPPEASRSPFDIDETGVPRSTRVPVKGFDPDTYLETGLPFRGEGPRTAAPPPIRNVEPAPQSRWPLEDPLSRSAQSTALRSQLDDLLAQQAKTTDPWDLIVLQRQVEEVAGQLRGMTSDKLGSRGVAGIREESRELARDGRMKRAVQRAQDALESDVGAAQPDAPMPPPGAAGADSGPPPPPPGEAPPPPGPPPGSPAPPAAAAPADIEKNVVALTRRMAASADPAEVAQLDAQIGEIMKNAGVEPPQAPPPEPPGPTAPPAGPMGPDAGPGAPPPFEPPMPKGPPPAPEGPPPPTGGLDGDALAPGGDLGGAGLSVSDDALDEVAAGTQALESRWNTSDRAGQKAIEGELLSDYTPAGWMDGLAGSAVKPLTAERAKLIDQVIFLTDNGRPVPMRWVQNATGVSPQELGLPNASGIVPADRVEDLSAALERARDRLSRQIAQEDPLFHRSAVVGVRGADSGTSAIEEATHLERLQRDLPNTDFSGDGPGNRLVRSLALDAEGEAQARQLARARATSRPVGEVASTADDATLRNLINRVSEAEAPLPTPNPMARLKAWTKSLVDENSKMGRLQRLIAPGSVSQTAKDTASILQQRLGNFEATMARDKMRFTDHDRLWLRKQTKLAQSLSELGVGAADDLAGVDQLIDRVQRIDPTISDVSQFFNDVASTQEGQFKIARWLQAKSAGRQIVGDDVETRVARTILDELDAMAERNQGMLAAHDVGFDYFANPRHMSQYWKGYIDENGEMVPFTSPEARDARVKSSMGGKPEFMRPRKYEDFVAGIEAGLVPMTWNPVEMALMKNASIQRYLAGKGFIADAEKAGLLDFVPSGASAQPGWEKIDDSFFTKLGPGRRQKGGDYYMPADGARVLNNYLSGGLREGAFAEPYMWWRGVADKMLQARLGLSYFHMGAETLNSSGSDFALALDSVVHGKPVKAAGQALRGATPFASIADDVYRGSKGLAWWLAGGNSDSPTSKFMMDYFASNSKLSEFLPRATDAWKQAIKDHNVVGAVLRAPFAALEVTARPMFEFLVPRAKIGAFTKLMEQEIGNATAKLGRPLEEMERLNLARNVAATIDNRFGMLNYDNLLLNRSMRDMMQGLVGAPGWNIGTLREFGGGALDAAKAAKAFAKGEEARFFTPRVNFVLGLGAASVVYGSMVQYLTTGTLPEVVPGNFEETAKNFLAPRTDPTNPEIRSALPSYWNDMFKYARHPVATLSHKLTPAISVASDIFVTGKDFYNNRIYEDEDSLGTKAVKSAKYAVTSNLPYSLQSVKKTLEEKGLAMSDLATSEGRNAFFETPGRDSKGVVESILPFVGVQNAPRSLTQSSAEDYLSARASEKATRGSLSPEEAERARLRKRIENALVTGDKRGIQQLNDAFRAGHISARQRDSMLTSAQKERRWNAELKASGEPVPMRFKAQIERAHFEDLVNAWDKMDPAQRRVAYPVIERRGATQFKGLTGDQQRALWPTIRRIRDEARAQ